MTTCMDLEGIILSEIGQTESKYHMIPYDFLYVWNFKNKTKSRNRPVYSQNNLMVVRGEGYRGVGKMDGKE